MKEFFLQMLDTRDPSVSSTRFLSLMTVLTILYTWMWVSIYTQMVHDIPVGVYTLAAVVVTGKAVEKFAERPTANTTTIVETASKTVTGDTNANSESGNK
jgi:hypothetical protein